MEIFFDELQFDNRQKEDLFRGIKFHKPSYADILKQWVTGARLTDYEKNITASILIYYPEYILVNGKAVEFIELINKYLLQEDLQNPLNPEKGLFLYTLFFLLLKDGKKKESLEILENLERLFDIHGVETGISGNDERLIREPSLNKKFKNTTSSITANSLENAYIKILTLIMDSREILVLKPGFNISKLPCLPFKNLSFFEGTNFRGRALEFYYKKEYNKASAIYRNMLINKFESPGTLAHMARLEVICNNIDKAEIFIVNAWRIRHEAPAYVLVRILYFIILINIVRTKPYDKWFGCLKHVLNQPDCKMQWEMDRVLSQYENIFIPQQNRLLKTLLEVLSGTEEEINLEKFEEWQKTAPIPFEAWPDFDIDELSGNIQTEK